QRVDEKVIDYAVRIVRATRDWPGLAIGAGSRGAIALVRAARVVALLSGRDFVTPDDIKGIALPALRHRIALTPDALLEGRKPARPAARGNGECAGARGVVMRVRLIPGRRAMLAVGIGATCVLAALILGTRVSTMGWISAAVGLLVLGTAAADYEMTRRAW